MTHRREFLYVAAGAAAAGLTPAVGRSTTQAPPGVNGADPQQMSERQRLIAEAHFGRKQKATSTHSQISPTGPT